MIERIRNGRTDLVFDHLAGGGDARATDDQGVPLIRWCSYYGDVSAVRMLLDHGESLSALGDNLDLNGAAFHGHWCLCEFLIEQGADPNLPLPDTKETPLHAAVSRISGPMQEEVVHVLLAGGADPEAATMKGAETGAFMRDVRCCGETVLHRAAAYGSEGSVRLLLEAGASRDARDDHGDSPLSWASRHLRPAAILRLLVFGPHALHPDANWTGDHGQGVSHMDRQLVGRSMGPSGRN